MTKINIHGSCVTRDAFEINKDEFVIGTYISRNSVFSSTCSPLPISPEEFNTEPAYLKRMVYYDLNKYLFKKLKEDLNPWLVIDLIDERFGLLEFELEDGRKTCITCSSNFDKSDILSNGSRYSKTKHRFIDTNKFTKEEIKSKVFLYCSEILKIYKAEQVIINESYCCGHYLDQMGRVVRFEDKTVVRFKELNNKLKLMYGYLKEAMPGCHVIKMPEPIYSSENHKWGLEPFHYEEKYYDNVIEKCKNIINNGNNK